MTVARCLMTTVIVALSTVAASGQDDQGHQMEPAGSAADMTAWFPSRAASGTSWQPALTPMAGFHASVGDWMLMGHANVYAQFLYESGGVHRTSRQAGSISWFMGMARRPVGRGRIGLRAMLSLEPWTIAGCGYPDLLATGEICTGDSIHDQQHPDDLFMELAADYERPITEGLRVHAYAALAGEPALGPPAYPHRASAFPNPIAPITHQCPPGTFTNRRPALAASPGGMCAASSGAALQRPHRSRRRGIRQPATDSPMNEAWLTCTLGPPHTSCT